MSNNLYLYEKLLATRHAEIRRDMQLSRKPAHIEQSPTFVENAANRFGTWLVNLGSRLQRTEQQHGASLL
jgi:hypothetical protein